MSYFITSFEIMKKYGIRESQIIDILESGYITPYDIYGVDLQHEDIHNILDDEYIKAERHYMLLLEKNNNIDRITLAYFMSEETKSAIHEKSKQSAYINTARRMSFISEEFHAILKKTFPDVYRKYGFDLNDNINGNNIPYKQAISNSASIQSQSITIVGGFESLNSMPIKDDIIINKNDVQHSEFKSYQAQKWKQFAETRTKDSEKKSSIAASLKHDGFSNARAYEEIEPKPNDVAKISGWNERAQRNMKRYKKYAEQLAHSDEGVKAGLEMPPWDTRGQAKTVPNN